MGKLVKEPPIIKTNEWGAIPPKVPITIAPRPHETLFHHTAGHHPEISRPTNESVAESIRYAREIQHFHMFDRGHMWNDSGHNFMVCRNGVILVGRHQSYTRVKVGEMVVSAHCPGHNSSPGVEIEHVEPEPMTPIQFEHVSWLYAWIHDRCRIMRVTIYPHRAFFATNCPGTLMKQLPDVCKRVDQILVKGEL